MPKCPKGVMQHPIFNSVVEMTIPFCIVAPRVVVVGIFESTLLEVPLLLHDY